MSGPSSSGRSVKLIPTSKIKKEILDDVEDTVLCKICMKGFVSNLALNNHARIEHIDTYLTGDSTLWTMKVDPDTVKKEKPNKTLWLKADQLISEMKPITMTTLASNDVSYIIIKNEEDETNETKKRSRGKRDEKSVAEVQAITGPFECFHPSNTVEDGICHQIFFSCCEYSIHYRDEHTKRRKGLCCQVCEKPLVCNGVDPQLPFICKECGEGFETSKALSEHMSTAHVKLKPYDCQVCHKRFTQLGGVLQHMRMHTGDRPFPCTFCSKAFTQKSGLDQHLRIHTKVKPYRCVVCQKTFSQSVHLKQHMRTHTQVAPFQCGFCDKRFKQSSHLNYHLKNHNPAKMSEDQKAKYSELIGLMAKNFVEVEMDGQHDGDVEYMDQEQCEIDIEPEEEEQEQEQEELEEQEGQEQEIEGERVIVEGQEMWAVCVSEE